VAHPHEREQIKRDIKDAPKEETHKEASAPKSEMDQLKERLAVLEGQLATALQLIPQKTATPTVVDTGPIIRVTPAGPPAEGSKRKWFQVSLEHARMVILPYDVVSGTELLVRDMVVREYNRLSGIIRTNRDYQVLDVTENEEARQAEAAKAKAEAAKAA
jgi:hypothetical protein